jgi:16S rRNA C967 or C1407 C5-methylase (RsmB/RsmF family)
MGKPSNLLIKLSRQLFTDAIEQEQFIDALVHPKPFNPCILWCKPRPEIVPFEVEPRLNWQPIFVDRLTLQSKPGQHPLHDAGYFYCLDFSSVFAASVMSAINSADLVFDMCASPGGKSVFAWTMFHPKQLFSNEVIGKRRAALISNFKRCEITPSVVLTLDSKILAEELPKTMDLVLVDAPCSGQSLIAKGSKADGCFHPININKNANRQKRILANSAQLVKPQGYLVYMTCTYSTEENEQVIDWLIERFPQFETVEVSVLEEYRSHLSDQFCYRIFPQHRFGAGAFTTLLRNTEIGEAQSVLEAFFDRPGMVFI